MAVLVVLLGVVVALLGLLVAGLLRGHAEIIRSLHDLGVNLDPDAPPSTTPRPPAARTEPQRMTRPDRLATDLVGETPRGDAISIGVVGTSHPTLLAFLTSGCSTCAGFWSAFADDRLQVPGGARLVAVTKGPEGDSPGRLTKFAPPDVPVVMSTDAWTAYDVPVAPYFVYIDGPSGAIIGEGASATWEHLSGMIEQALADAGMETGSGSTLRRSTRHQDRVERVDDALHRAGIEPGDPRLYPESAGGIETESLAPPAERR